MLKRMISQRKKKRKISLDDNNIKQLKKRRLDIKKESGDLNNNKTEENGLPLFVIQNLEDLNKLNNVNIKKAKSLTSIHEPNSSKSSDEKSSSSSIEVEKSTPKKNVEKKPINNTVVKKNKNSIIKKKEESSDESSSSDIFINFSIPTPPKKDLNTKEDKKKIALPKNNMAPPKIIRKNVYLTSKFPETKYNTKEILDNNMIETDNNMIETDSNMIETDVNMSQPNNDKKEEQPFSWAKKSEIDLNIDFEKLPKLTDPKINNIIAFREYEVSSRWCPELSKWKVGKIINFDSKKLSLEILNPENPPIELEETDDLNAFHKVVFGMDYIIERDFNSLKDVRIV